MAPSTPIRVIDSHTEGEPTRVVLEGAPDLGSGPAADRLATFRSQHDHFRSAVVNEPRGNDALVGALLLEPHDPKNLAQVIFFNNVGVLGMCVHGTIGVARTLAHLGRLPAGTHTLETPAGNVTIAGNEDGSISVANVFSFRHQTNVAVETNSHGTFHGDIAWGGNWFYLVKEPSVELHFDKIHELTELTWHIRQSLIHNGITGANSEEIDHIELFAAPTRRDADSRNFVLCPGRAYDRSPCGTGTSAKMACLVADGKLAVGETWGQESIIGSLFRGTFTPATEGGIDGVYPTVSGHAHITAEATLHLDPADPFQHGFAP